MKRNVFMLKLLGAIMCCGATTVTAADQCYAPGANCCEWSFYDGKIVLGADWLYWKVQEDGISPGSFSNGEIAPTLEIIRPDYKYSNGFRVNLGYELPCDCWDVNLAYSYVPTSAKTTRYDGLFVLGVAPYSPDVNYYPILEPINTIISTSMTAPSETVFAKWNTNINCFDVDLGRTVCFGECLKVRPHIGFRTIWLNQKFFVETAIKPSTSVTETVDAIMKEKYTGYGVEGGLWAGWEVGCGFSVVGHVGGSILYSKFSINHKAILLTTTTEGPTSTVVTSSLETIHDTIHTGTPTADYFVGLQYSDCLCDMLFSVVIGWEQHVMFDMNRLSTVPGNLVTQGLTLGCQIGF
ncbi:MAG: Lpg1974 family pore-forming outer membrane protein [Parachlamydiaceae bacterium]